MTSGGGRLAGTAAGQPRPSGNALATGNSFAADEGGRVGGDGNFGAGQRVVVGAGTGGVAGVGGMDTG